MKHISILACILGMCLVLTASAQQAGTKPLVSKHAPHRIGNRSPEKSNAMGSQSFNSHADLNYGARIWELGTYPGGTWFATEHINDLGVIVGRGDVPGTDGNLYNHTRSSLCSGRMLGNGSTSAH